MGVGKASDGVPRERKEEGWKGVPEWRDTMNEDVKRASVRTREDLRDDRELVNERKCQVRDEWISIVQSRFNRLRKEELGNFYTPLTLFEKATVS